MCSMSDDDVAYSALLAQLLADSAPSRNARVHSWIEHQYDFALSEQSISAYSRPPSPSPSSSLGANRTYSIDRPDSPLLPRFSSERPSSPCPSYDALFFPPPSTANTDDFEEKERVRTLRFIVQEMAHWKSQTTADPQHASNKSIPVPPPSPASSVTQSTSSRPMRSRSSSTCISRLPSFTSTLSSDQSQPQEISSPPPVSVIVHGEFQHDLVLRHDGYLHKRDDSFTHPLMHAQDQDGQFLCPSPDDKESLEPSPTLSNFSCAYSRESSLTTPYASSPASPTSIVFSPCNPENIALPASPTDEQAFPAARSIHERTASYQTSIISQTSIASTTASPPKMTVFPASPVSHAFLAAEPVADNAPQRLRAPKSMDPQSRWSIATTASLTPSTADPKSNLPRTPSKDKKDKGQLKTPRKRTRFISLISRFSPGRNDVSTASSQATEDVEFDSANESDTEDKEKSKQRKSLSKKSSLASLRASFSLSRASFSSQRPPISSPIEEVPPLPMSPTLTSPVAEVVVPLEAAPPLPKPLSRIPSRANIMNASLPPIPQSASTIATFQSSSQLSVSDNSAPSASESRISLACPNPTPNVSRISLLPPPSKRTSLASAAGIEPMVSTDAAASQATVRSKSIFRLTAKPKSLKTPISSGTKRTPTSSKLPVAGNTSLPSPTAARSKIPQVPNKFNPPAKLATVIATQSRQAPVLATLGPTSISKLPAPPSRTAPKVPRPIITSEKAPAESLPPLSPSSRLPMPASAKGARIGTVKGFWKRQ